jgi:hypothetical protein
MVGRTNRNPLQRWSKEALGHEHRLAVALVLSISNDILDLDEIIKRSGASRTAAFNDLEFLVKIGAIQKMQQQRNNYQKLPRHPFWAFLTALMSVAPEDARLSL